MMPREDDVLIDSFIRNRSIVDRLPPNPAWSSMGGTATFGSRENQLLLSGSGFAV